MGFPRRAARHALVRCSNNVTAATEYLLMHPELVTLMSDDSTVSREEAGDQPTNESGTTTAQNELGYAEYMDGLYTYYNA